MKTMSEMSVQPIHSTVCAGRASGFTLIELMVAMAVFLVVAGTAFSVFGKHMAMITHQESLSGVNLALRNATNQMQMDLSGAGQNLLGSLGTFATGVVIQNEVAAAQGGTAPVCVPAGGSFAYPVPSACFDSLTIFNPPNVGCAATTNGQPPVLVIQDASTENLSSNGTILAADPAAGANLNTDKGCFQSGDELLVIQMPSGANLPCGFTFCVSAVQLTSTPTVSGTVLQLSHSLTSSSGAPSGCPGASCSDPQGVIYNPNSGTGTNFVDALYASFSTGAYVVDIGGATAAITYQVQVNPLNNADTQLMRCDSNGCAVLADQVIGFKVGASLWNDESNGQADIANYFYNSDAFCSEWFAGADCNAVPPVVPGNDPYDFSLIRAVRVSLVGRTSPNADLVLNQFTNGFDGGPYLVQQSSVVVDLRNMSIGDFQN